MLNFALLLFASACFPALMGRYWVWWYEFSKTHGGIYLTQRDIDCLLSPQFAHLAAFLGVGFAILLTVTSAVRLTLIEPLLDCTVYAFLAFLSGRLESYLRRFGLLKGGE